MISPYLKIAADNNKELLSFRPIPKDTLKSLREFYRVPSKAIASPKPRPRSSSRMGSPSTGNLCETCTKPLGMPRRTIIFTNSQKTRLSKNRIY